MKKVGIHAASFYLPSIYVDIKDLAIKRDIEYDLLDSRCFCSNILSYRPEASMIGTCGDKSP